VWPAHQKRILGCRHQLSYKDFTGNPAVLSNKFYKYDGEFEYHPAQARKILDELSG
jgi:hypothetical protein